MFARLLLRGLVYLDKHSLFLSPGPVILLRLHFSMQSRANIKSVLNLSQKFAIKLYPDYQSI
uniref:AlNc14C144G7345 protein n=1 Tax=Albugo laibachii Nc14 TaxID=890382 RepID=F0WLF7_9STRA|nr:AlNc14C144G7345 [Albugo laibachii Nc14]CCA23388.1 AlNc14C192G8465 [Albugo laibachii Nc14]|eukprot:CCA23388.1 AlNc14C192G8465 [Albugo laibachii Nc14]